MGNYDVGCRVLTPRSMFSKPAVLWWRLPAVQGHPSCWNVVIPADCLEPCEVGPNPGTRAPGLGFRDV